MEVSPEAAAGATVVVESAAINGASPVSTIAPPTGPAAPVEGGTITEHAPAAAPFDWRRLIPLALVVALIVVYITFFFGPSDGTDEGSQATTATTAEPLTVTTAAVTTTVAPATTEAPTTTAPPTTTTSTLVPQPNALLPAGDAISVPGLRLRAGGVGPLDFGAPASEVIGRLVASLGPAEETGIAGEDLSLCPSETGIYVRWGELTMIFLGDVSSGSLAGYRLQEPLVPASHIDIATFSGIRLGDTVSDLEATYAQYTLDFDVIGGETFFMLTDGAELLLWGPLSSTEPSGRISGIYSPPICQAS